jgi:hypothetical protein
MRFSHKKGALFCLSFTLFNQNYPNQKNKFNHENRFTTWSKLNPRIQDHENTPAHRSAFLAWKELERGLNKSGLIDDHSNNKLIKKLQSGEKFLNVSLRQFRLFLNRICLFEVTVNHLSVIKIQEMFWHCWSIWKHFILLWESIRTRLLENLAVCHTFLQTFKINWLIFWELEYDRLLFHQSRRPSTTVSYLRRLQTMCTLNRCRRLSDLLRFNVTLWKSRNPFWTHSTWCENCRDNGGRARTRGTWAKNWYWSMRLTRPKHALEGCQLQLVCSSRCV